MKHGRRNRRRWTLGGWNREGEKKEEGRRKGKRKEGGREGGRVEGGNESIIIIFFIFFPLMYLLTL